ncbi:MAG: CBS domain-containing protein, partial [Deltaproteobacteria bacterium]|nr:CBS domain-containing protein [Deltaproteobacteria bacterium]
MDNEITYVIGHKNPDTDSVASAIGLAALRRAQGHAGVVAARAGDINRQTAFVLDYLKLAPPVYLSNVFPKAKDVMSPDVVSVDGETPLSEVMEMMRAQRIRYVPVLGAGRRPVGALTLMDLAKRYVEMGAAVGGREVRTTLPNLVRTLKADSVLDFLGNADVTFALYVAAMSVDSFEDILAGRRPQAAAIVVGDRQNIQLAAIRRGVGLIIVSGGFRVSDEVKDAARAARTSIVVTAFDSATAANLAGLSTPARLVCPDGYISAAPDDLCDDIRHRLVDADGLVVVDGDGVMQGVVTKTSLIKESRTSLILVDHNELGQAVDGADKVNIREIIDHHRLGSLQTAQPITFL